MFIVHDFLVLIFIKSGFGSFDTFKKILLWLDEKE